MGADSGNGKYYRPVPDTDWNLRAGTHGLRPPEPPANTMLMPTAVAPGTYVGQSLTGPGLRGPVTHQLRSLNLLFKVSHIARVYDSLIPYQTLPNQVWQTRVQ